jgi:hypothetical protein
MKNNKGEKMIQANKVNKVISEIQINFQFIIDLKKQDVTSLK